MEQGWIAPLSENGDENHSPMPSASANTSKELEFSEAVIVHYDPTEISLDTLIEIHLHTHSSTSDHPMRKKYRSAVYYFDQTDITEIEQSIDACRDSFAEAIITKVLGFGCFKENKEEYQNYYQKNPEGQFCQRYINPKIELLKTEFAKFI